MRGLSDAFLDCLKLGFVQNRAELRELLEKGYKGVDFESYYDAFKKIILQISHEKFYECVVWSFLESSVSNGHDGEKIDELFNTPRQPEQSQFVGTCEDEEEGITPIKSSQTSLMDRLNGLY
jgi:hypothetical protein